MAGSSFHIKKNLATAKLVQVSLEVDPVVIIEIFLLQRSRLGTRDMETLHLCGKEQMIF